jgi:hypothetical protein
LRTSNSPRRTQATRPPANPGWFKAQDSILQTREEQDAAGGEGGGARARRLQAPTTLAQRPSSDLSGRSAKKAGRIAAAGMSGEATPMVASSASASMASAPTGAGDGGVVMTPP